MNLKEFQAEAEYLIEQLEDLVQNNMPLKGNKSSECQRTYLTQQINEVYYAINGTTQEDLEEDEED
jgi:hypothetical protein